MTAAAPPIDLACRVLAASSTGGHWAELMLLTQSLADLEVVYLSSDERDRADVPDAAFFAVPDANQNTPFKALACLWTVSRAVLRSRPAVVVSTGAAPGLFAVAVGALIGARTVWVESLASVSRISISGRLARRFVSRFLVQWPQLAERHGAEYVGGLL